MVQLTAPGAPLAASSPGLPGAPPSALPAPPPPPPDRSSSNDPSPSRWSAAHPLGRTLRLALIAAAVLGAVVFDVPLCPFAIITRHPCPGCGLTRATLALAHGQLGEALHFHPLAPVMSPLVLGAFALNAWSYVTRGRWAASETAQGKWITRVGLVLVVAMLGLWIARFFGAFGGPVPV